jgi:hypothetical protein
MATSAQFSTTPNLDGCVITGSGAANTARDGSGTEGTNILQCFAAGANGSRIDKITYAAFGTLVANTAGMLRFFIKTGASKRLWREYSLPATTPSASAVGVNNYSTREISGGLILKNGQTLWVTSHVADTAGNQFAITVEGGDF